MQIKLEVLENGLILHLAGEMDASTAILVDREMENFLHLKLDNLWVDCYHLKYLSSAGVGVFISYLQRFREENINFELYGLKPNIHNIFTVLGLESLLTLKSARETASLLRNFRKEGYANLPRN